MRRLGVVPPGRIRTAAIAVAAAVVVGGVVVIGAGDGHPTHDVRLLSGAAWFSSGKVGQVTLLDGTSAEVAAQVQVAPAGKSIEVVQQGSTAYAVDQTEGTVRRVDGATFEVSPAQSPIPDAHDGLTVIPSEKALYTLDSRRGILADIDPQTLVRRGELLSLASQLSVGAATVDDAGTLWTVDTATGDLSRVAGEHQTVRRQVVQAGRSILAVANGHPVVVDTIGRKAISVDRDSSRVTGTLELNLRKDDTIQVSGSPRSERLYVVAGRGSLDICDLAAGRCDKTIPLAAGSDFGAAVEADDRLFVPDYTAGQVWIVDLAQSKVVAKPKVLAPGGKFQLMTRDGIVFYNDINSAEAGVIQLDGTVSQIFKYDPLDPDKGVSTPSNGTPGQQTSQQTSSSRPNQPSNPQQPGPNNSQPNPDPNHPQPDPTDPGREDTLKITASKATPTVDEVVTFQVTSSTGAALSGIAWTFGDGENGSGQTTSHKWAAARPNPYNVAVTATVKDNDNDNDKQITVSVSVTVTTKPTVKLTVTNANGGGTITGDGGINCATATCEYNIEPKTKITLVAKPGQDHELGSWAGDCASTTDTCDVTMGGPKNVTYSFKTPEPIEITLFIGGGIMSPDDDGSMSLNGKPCSKECKYTVKRNQDVTLSRTAADENHTFGQWKNGCTGNVSSCTIHWDKSTTVSATFPVKFFFLKVSPSLGSRVVGSHGIDCPGVCEANFDNGEPVTITAKPDASKTFKTWGAGPPCGGFGPVCKPVFNERSNFVSPAFE